MNKAAEIQEFLKTTTFTADNYNQAIEYIAWLSDELYTIYGFAYQIKEAAELTINVGVPALIREIEELIGDIEVNRYDDELYNSKYKFIEKKLIYLLEKSGYTATHSSLSAKLRFFRRKREIYKKK